MMRSLLRALEGRKNPMLRLIGRLVRCESPSHDKRAVDAMGEMVAAEWRERGAKVEILRERNRGHHLRAELWLGRRRPRGQILVLGHLDTVYPLGTLLKMPFRVSGGRAWGPGVFDMKAGLALALFAIDALRATLLRPEKPIVFLWTSDEEIGSLTSRATIEREARRSDAVLVLEPAFGRDGRLKTARKGVGHAELRITGRAAHAGIDPEHGVNAVHELALQIQLVMRMSQLRRGVTVQATVIEGGTVANVVPERARAELDIRLARESDGPWIERQLRSLRPVLKGARVEVRGGVNRPPLERTAAVEALFSQARSLLKDLGVPLRQAATGGGSDGNFTAGVGAPTLDGLGAVGGGAHTPGEHVFIDRLPERAALIAGLLATL